jgi:isopenicillin-N epimerase
MPVKELAAISRAAGILVAIDGAHALGQIPLDIPSLGVDFYIANAHKWLYTPKVSGT